MNYGYDSTDPLWKENRKHLLSERLTLLAELYNAPIEVDKAYDGVRFRKLTDLTKGDLNNLIEVADQIFIEVML
jgi:hypothetical protein